MPYQRVVAYTLVDITPTGCVHVRDSNLQQYHQMQNYNVLLQTIGLRAQPFKPHVDILHQQDLSQYAFDSSYSGSHTVWRLTFEHEHAGVWSDGADDLAVLKQDVHGVAITNDLDNTADFSVNVFDCLNAPNTYFEDQG